MVQLIILTKLASQTYPNNQFPTTIQQHKSLYPKDNPWYLLQPHIFQFLLCRHLLKSLTVSTIWYLVIYFLSDNPANYYFTAVFDKNTVKVFKYTEVNINALCPPVIQGHHNSPSQPLYSVSLPTHPPPIHKSNATINVS